MKVIVLLISVFALASSDDSDLSPYAGEEQRFIKSLSPEEIKSLKAEVREELLEAEMGLDRDFEKGVITPGSLESALTEIGRIRAQLRYVHLEAHLRQKRLLTTDQIAKYGEIRGYRFAEHDHEGHAKSHK